MIESSIEVVRKIKEMLLDEPWSIRYCKRIIPIQKVIESKIEEIELKIQDAAYSLKTFGTMTKQASFINGAKWAIHNLTDEEIKHLRENSDPDDHSFFGL